MEIDSFNCCYPTVSVKTWLYVHLFGQIFLVLWATHFYHLLTGMFIPIAGRSGSFENPEVSLALICWLLSVYITSYLNPLVSLLRRSRWFFASLLAVFVLTRWGCLTMTQAGFPYRGTAENPTPQRHMITVSRNEFNREVLTIILVLNDSTPCERSTMSPDTSPTRIRASISAIWIATRTKPSKAWSHPICCSRRSRIRCA